MENKEPNNTKAGLEGLHLLIAIAAAIYGMYVLLS